MTGIGHSPLRPNMAWNRSDCSVLVGRPVLGPPRCTLMIDHRQFEHHAPVPWPRPLSAMPGPLVVVTAMAPPNAAPIVEQIAAISSSA